MSIEDMSDEKKAVDCPCGYTDSLIGGVYRSLV